jgi:hypothetical protein
MEMMPGASGLANMMQGQSEVEATVTLACDGM